eukprot:2690563-Amphidinium_carterae.1
MECQALVASSRTTHVTPKQHFLGISFHGCLIVSEKLQILGNTGGKIRVGGSEELAADIPATAWNKTRKRTIWSL